MTDAAVAGAAGGHRTPSLLHARQSRYTDAMVKNGANATLTRYMMDGLIEVTYWADGTTKELFHKR